MNLRLATRDSIERAIAAFEDATRHDPEYAMAWAALGGAYSLKGSFLSIRDLVEQAIEMERRALAIDPDLSDAHSLARHRPAQPRPDRRSDRGDQRSDPPRARERPGAPGAGARATGSAREISPPRSPSSSSAIELNPEAGYSYLQLGLLLAWEGQYERRRGSLPPRRRAPGSVHLGQRRAAGRRRERRLGYVYYLQGRYDEAHPRVRARAGLRRLRAITR